MHPRSLENLKPFTSETAREAASKPRLPHETRSRSFYVYKHQSEWLDKQGRNASATLRAIIDKAMNESDS